MGRALLPLLLMLSGCLLELGEEVACGDGYVDRAAGEACDPEDLASFENVCDDPARVGACDPETCQIDRTACLPTCGNGELDPGEECDPGPSAASGPGVLGTGIPCVSLDGGSTYTKGETFMCGADCRWDRTPCSQCGDDTIQDHEVCEATRDSVDAADAFCFGVCVKAQWDIRPAQGDVKCDSVCNDSCTAYELASADVDGCCIRTYRNTNPNVPCCSGNQQDGTCIPGLSE